MALSLSEGLKEARNIPTFNGTNEYQLTNYLRDVNIIISLMNEEHKPIITSILVNRLQGKALQAVETLLQPTWEQILDKLREEFGVKESFYKLRTDALNVSANNIDELHNKLLEILNKMNKKYSLNPDNNMFSPTENEKNIFGIYLNSLPLYIKSLLIQNNIGSINKAIAYYLENDLLSDIYIKGKQKSGSKKFKNQKKDGQNNNNSNNGNSYKPHTGNVYGHNSGNGFGRYEHNDQNHEPMELGNVTANENFHTQPQNPTYQ